MMHPIIGAHAILDITWNTPVTSIIIWQKLRLLDLKINDGIYYYQSVFCLCIFYSIRLAVFMHTSIAIQSHQYKLS